MAIIRTLINWFKGNKMPLNPTTLAVPGVGSFRGINPNLDIVLATLTGAGGQQINSRVDLATAVTDTTNKGFILLKRRNAAGNWSWNPNYTDTNTADLASPSCYFINDDTALPGVRAQQVQTINTTGCIVNNVNPAGDYVFYFIREQRAIGWFTTYSYTGQPAPIFMNPLLGGTDVTKHLPGIIISKHSDTTNIDAPEWYVHHRTLGATQVFFLNNNGAANTSNAFNNFLPTLTQWSVAGNNNFNTNIYRAYIFADNKTSDGNSCVGSYVGNGNIVGPVNFCGWKPDIVIIKANAARNWAVFDRPRGIIGAANDPEMQFNLQNAETATKDIGIDTKNFQVRTTNIDVNELGTTYYWWALRWQDR